MANSNTLDASNKQPFEPISQLPFGGIELLDMLLDILDGGELFSQFNREIAGYLIFADPNRFAHILQRILRDKVVFDFA